MLLPCTHPARVPAQLQRAPQDELVATEAVFRGLLAGLTPEEAVALMSALVFQVRGRGGTGGWGLGARGGWG
jgi:superfamily II RNA helicase